MNQLLTTREVSQMLGVSKQRVRQFVSAGRLRAIERLEIGHRSMLFFTALDVEHFAAIPRQRGRPLGYHPPRKSLPDKG